LNQSDKDVDKVELQADAFVDCISPHQASFSQSRSVKDALHIVQREATEDGKSAIKPKVLGDGQSSHRRYREHQWSETTESNDGNASEKWRTEVQVFLLLRCCANKGY